MFGHLLTYRGRPRGWLSLLAMAEMAMVLGSGRLSAADASITNIWTGAGANGAISLSGNWQGGVVPEDSQNKAKNDVWIFQNLTSGLTTPLVNQGDPQDDQNVAQIYFGAGAPGYAFSSAGAYSIDIWGDSTGLGIYQGSANTQTFSSPVNLRQGDRFPVGSGWRRGAKPSGFTTLPSGSLTRWISAGRRRACRRAGCRTAGRPF